MRVSPFLYSHAHAREKRFSLFKEKKNEKKNKHYKKRQKKKEKKNIKRIEKIF